MAVVQGTQNYVYFPDQSLGVGASGSVYLGRHKRQGKKCACKVFRNDGGPREELAKQREFEVMKKLSHDNVVKFFAIEQESHGKAKILVMEYCAGGSVYKMLEEPQHVYGFPEEEFIIFLRDITKALQYLSKERIVHRDIKPGNILRCIGDDLRSVYKLTDFGAARQLPESGEFMSLYGTEEYLHPEIYGRALLGNRQYVPLNASVDLWSLGVTIYHVATGRLPFQSFGGRQNKEDMHRIISQKQSDVISGIQHTKDGPIDWSRELPQTCYLSRGLRKPLERMLRRLLEVDDNKRWNFETFFVESRKMTSHAPFHVFCVSTAMMERVYVTKCNATLSHFQEGLAELTNIPSARQQLFHSWYPLNTWLRSSSAGNNQEMLNLQETSDDQAACCNSRQKTTVDRPIFLYPFNIVSFEWRMANYELPKLPELIPSPSLSDDINFARAAAGYVRYLHNSATRVISAQSSLMEFVKCLIDQLSKEIGSLRPYEELYRLTVDRCRSSLHQSMVAPFSDPVGRDGEVVIQRILTSMEDFENNALMTFMDQCRSKVCSTEHCCLKKIEHSIQELENIYDIFREHKRKELSHNEQQIHKFDRGRIPALVSRAHEHYNTHCRPNTELMLSIVTKWFSSVFLPKKAELDKGKETLRDCVLKIQSSAVPPTLLPLSLVDSSISRRPVGRTEPIPAAIDQAAPGRRPFSCDGRGSATSEIQADSPLVNFERLSMVDTFAIYRPSSNDERTNEKAVDDSDMGVKYRAGDTKMLHLDDGSNRTAVAAAAGGGICGSATAAAAAAAAIRQNDDSGIGDLMTHLQKNSDLIKRNTEELEYSSHNLKSLLDSLSSYG